MEVEQYVMAYGVEQDRLRALLPEGFRSLRPVLRINAELRDGVGYVEFNTAVETDAWRGWRNIAYWENVPVTRCGRTVCFRTDFLTVLFTGTGLAGGCPAEKDNAGCWFEGRTPALCPPDTITARKEFCDCVFAWCFGAPGAHGVSEGKTLPAVPTPPETVYPALPLTAENAAAIPCRRVLGTYTVRFTR